MLSSKSFNLTLYPGDTILRRELHASFGGQTQSGISPSSKVPMVMLFSDPSRGEQYGYFDGWRGGGFFHYSGEGQRGDQEMKRGNKALRDHQILGRQIHIFEGNGKGQPVTYIGDFEYADYYETDAPEIGGGPLRKVFMFRLRPIDALTPKVRNTVGLAQEISITTVAVEQHLTEKSVLDPAREPIEAERRESVLVQQYKLFLESRNSNLVRNRIQPAGQAKPLYTDLFDPARNLLIEAKGSVTRESIRMALGQLLDYARFFQPRPNPAVLIPSKLRTDLQELLSQYQVGVIERNEDGFTEHLIVDQQP